VTTDDEPLLSSTEVAKRLGINTRTMSRWVQDGKLTPAYKTPGGKYRWRWSEVREQLGLRERSD